MNVQRLKSFSAVIATALITAFALLAFTAVRAIQHTRRPLGPLVLLVIVLIFLPVLSARWYARRTADQAVRQLGYHPDDLNEPLTIDDYAELIARE